MEQNSFDEIKIYNPNEQYERLPILLKRYSFEEKMRIAHIYSSKGILFDTKRRKNESSVLPWCVETFVMLAMEAEEYNDDDFKGNHEKKAIQMLNTIWDSTSVFLKRSCGRFEFIDRFLPLTLLSQLKCQAIDWIIKYRYWYMLEHNFSQVPLKELFEEKMGAPYEEYLLFGEILEVIFLAQSDNKNVTIPYEVLEYIFMHRFPTVAKNMTISRKNYVELQRKYIKNEKDTYRYIYSLCPSVRYPLVEEGDNIFFPLPHLLIQSVTSSLMYRLTEENDLLRGKIGKHVLEQYLYDIINESGVYQEVFSEVSYKKSREESLSPDVMARLGNKILFLDSKSTVPNIGMRVLEATDFERNIAIVGKNIAKLARQMRDFNKYNPFKGAVSFENKNHWGVVVVQEDAFIRRQFYYEKAAEHLGIEKKSKEWEWLVEHIKVASLYEVEKIALSGHCIIEACKSCFEDDPYVYPFLGFPKGEFNPMNKKAIEFAERHNEKIDKVVDELKQLLGVRE